jgi:hypothetical protein
MKSSSAKKNRVIPIKLGIWRIIFRDNTYFFPALLKTLPHGLPKNQPGRKERALKTLDLQLPPQEDYVRLLGLLNKPAKEVLKRIPYFSLTKG